MDPLSRLPLECLQRIFDILVQDGDIDSIDDNNENNNSSNDYTSSTLAALFQTNRYIATVVIPYLYKDPYRFSPLVVPSAYYDYGVQKPLMSRIPTRTLLSSLLPLTTLPKVLSLGLQFAVPPSMSDSEDSPTANDSTTAASTPTGASSGLATSSQLNYLAQIRHLHQLPAPIGVEQLWKWAQPPPGVLTYIHTPEFEDLCRNAKLIRQDFGEYAVLYPNQTLNQRCYQILFFQEANWALANPILEQLQSLTIPLADVDRYLEPSVMVRMVKLERVHFLLGRLKTKEEDQEEWTPYEDRSEDSQRTLARKFYPLVRFVEEHTRLFNGVLREVTMEGSVLWRWFGAECSPCPDSVEMEVHRLLPALRTPLSLTTDASVLRFLAHIDTTDVSKVSELGSKVLHIDGTGEAIRGIRDALQRFRTLRKLTCPSLGEGAFRWAVDEKNRLADFVRTSNGQDALKAHADRTETKGEGQALRQADLWIKGLVPLEDVSISNYGPVPLTDEVDDIAVGFSQTLQSLCVRYSMQSYPQVDIEHESPVGKRWVDLLALTHLQLSIDYWPLLVDRHLLTHCPNVVSVCLADGASAYRCEDIEPCLPADLRSLETLYLMGWPALSFHSATLHSTTRLKELSVILPNIGIEDGYWRYTWDGNEEISGYCSYIPPIEELNRSYGIQTESSTMPPALVRPRWSWDWHLPCLESLRLTSEFALLFDFHMLLKCPALQKLDLDFRTYQNEHTRAITRADLFTTTPITGDNDGDGSNYKEEPIIAPSLVKLRLHGRWAFDNLSTKHQFLSTMFPALESLSVAEWVDFSLTELIHWAKNKVPIPIRSLGLDMVAPSIEDLERLGLVEGDHTYFPEDWMVAIFVGFTNGKDYVILRERE